MASTVQRDCISRHLVIVFVVYYLVLLEKLKLNRWQTSAYVSRKGKGGGQKESKQDHPHKVPLSPHFTCMILIFPLHRESIRFCTATFPLTLLPAKTFPQSPDKSPSYEKWAARLKPLSVLPPLSLVQMSGSGGPFWLKLGEYLNKNSIRTWHPDRR